MVLEQRVDNIENEVRYLRERIDSLSEQNHAEHVRIALGLAGLNVTLWVAAIIAIIFGG